MNPTKDQAPARALSDDAITVICESQLRYKAFRERPVRNFLSTLYNTGNWQDKMNAIGNLRADAVSYRWGPPIVRAIEKGIKLAFK